MSKQVFPCTVVVRGSNGEQKDTAEFPGVLQAALRLLVNSVLVSSLGPAVTPDLLRSMKEHLSSGLLIGGRNYVVVICVPKTHFSGRTAKYRQSFFALAEKGHGDRMFYPEHRDCAVAHLEEF